MPRQEVQRLRAQVGAGLDAKVVHLGRRRRADAVELARPAGASTKAGPILGVMTNSPSGLRWSEASLARNLL